MTQEAVSEQTVSLSTSVSLSHDFVRPQKIPAAAMPAEVDACSGGCLQWRIPAAADACSGGCLQRRMPAAAALYLLNALYQ